MGFRNSITQVSLSGPVQLAAGGVVGISGNVPVLNAAGTALSVVSEVDEYDQGVLSFPLITATKDYGAAISPYGGIAVYLPPGSALAVGIQNSTKGITTPLQTSPIQPGVAGNRALLYFPVPFDVGDHIVLLYRVGFGGVIVNVHPLVYGFSALPPNAPTLRPDGLLPAIGSLAVQSTATVSGTIIAAPGVSVAILLRSLYVNGIPNAAGGKVGLFGMVGGTAVSLALVGGASGVQDAKTIDYGPNGLLLDANSALSSSIAAVSAATCAALYDMVCVS